MGQRPQITEQQVDEAVEVLRAAIKHHLFQKGWGAFLSRHEILGVVEEEHKELIDAVQAKSLGHVSAELIDIAVGCTFGYACIKAGKMEW